uniref:Putative diguanylate cyclase (GGDEF) /phosphodiesterase (EAL), with bacterial extracellular solute-binding domain and PAS sensor domains n=1 Tax=Magnetococcus massalia (strain MO-1) TaxID=451514 RepID=A0A1S7LDG0_MAGMO|nr:putative diguanylate cyclase (GGDEF) /phosphodiesterase (EAL), with bacterial extracellular solute-binding domain and PAS sensor domains [Candidatus Magnetococcus massalia]
MLCALLIADRAYALNEIDLTPAEIEWLQNHPEIKMAVDIDWAPFEYVDPQSRYKGMAAEYIRLIEKRLDIAFQIDKKRKWPEMVKAVQNRDLDIFSCVVRTPQREAYALFTKPYLTFPMVIVTLEGQGFVDGIQDLIQHKHSVSVVKSYASHELLVQNFPQLNLHPTGNVKEGLEQVSSGQVYGFIGNLAVVSQVMRESGLTNLKISGQTPFRFELSMAVRNDWPELVPILQKAIDSITQEEQDEIFNKWIRVDYSQRVDYTIIFYTVTIGLLIFGFILYWNRKLKAEIMRRHVTELNLKRSKESLDKAQAIAHIGNWDWDIEHGSLAWSDEIYRIFGLSPQAFAATYEAFLESIHPDDRHLVKDAVAAALEDPNAEYEVEHRVVHPNGEERIVREIGHVLRNQHGQPIYMRGTVQDVTDFRSTEEKLILSKLVIENASEAILITDHQGQIIDVNPAYEQVTGYSADEVIGKNPNITQSGRHDASFYKTMWQTIRQTGKWEGEIWDRRKNGEVFPKWLTINTINNRRGKISHYMGIFTDISRQKSTEQTLEKLAFYDPLTSLPNRALFRDRLNHEMSLTSRTGGALSIFFIDLDRFKYVNDTFGHDVGDELLIEVSNRTVHCLRKSDTVCRLGGDEFTVILPDPGTAESVAQVARTIIESLQKPFQLKGHEVFIGASIGIAMFPTDGDNFEVLTKNADLAMYQAKEAGRGTSRFYTPEMNKKSELRLMLEADLRKALELKQFTLFYQPKIEVGSNSVAGMEALIRWIHPKKGMVSPVDFIPLAEETGLIIPLGAWILETACAQAKAWLDATGRELRVAVNLSAKQFQDPDLLENIQATLARTGLPVRLLELEITESVVMDDVESAIETIDAFKALGLYISIDDFGTGYSSLSYLKRFPLHSLKIDQSFVRDLTVDSDDAAIVESIISMAKAMGLAVIAEGVETDEQLGFLEQKKCGHIQGFFFSKPLPAEEFAAYVESCDPNCSTE